ncbi:AfsR/SARP family transcriptional regulator [Sphingopyxis sp.]|uniref:AfsR/SARP family transcriptional regulator n=1 Tax=Sphingopyxis sp. TaxID=1908224 RepID=UPI002FCABA9A
MGSVHQMVAIVGRLGVRPLVQLSLPARRILAYMALRGQSVSRGTAAEELWPDIPEDAGRANLRRSLWHLPRGWVTAVGDELMLEAECDLPQAHQAAARALNGEALTFDEIGLLSNDILPGWHEEWVLPAHEAFRMLRVQALEAACRTMAAQGLHALATQAGSAAVVAEPLRESAVEALIEAHLAQRNRYDAMLCYKALAKRLDEELGVMPNAELVERMAFCDRVPLAAS